MAGTGIGYFPPLMCGWEWLSEQKGVVTGVVLSAFGFSALIFSFISLAIMNPDNISPTQMPDGNLIYSAEIAERVSFK